MQSGEPRAERQPEDGLLVEQRVEDPSGAEAPRQAAGHPVDPALHADVLAEDDHPGVGLEEVAARWC